MYQTILVPLDGSKRAEAILPHVEDIARCYSAKVIFLQIVESQPILEPNVLEFTGWLREAEMYLNTQRNDFRTKGIEAKIIVHAGSIVETIITIAAHEEADLIALTSHGRSGLARVFYGSVAAGVLQRVDRPLLLVRSRELA